MFIRDVHSLHCIRNIVIEQKRREKSYHAVFLQVITGGKEGKRRKRQVQACLWGEGKHIGLPLGGKASIGLPQVLSVCFEEIFFDFTNFMNEWNSGSYTYRYHSSWVCACKTFVFTNLLPENLSPSNTILYLFEVHNPYSCAAEHVHVHVPQAHSITVMYVVYLCFIDESTVCTRCLKLYCIQ